MTNEIVLATEGQSLAEMMGLASNSSGSRSMLPRFSQIHNPIKGEIEVNGKKIKADAVPAGSYKLTQTDKPDIYAINPEIRIFALRLQWTRWDSDAKVMYKTVLVNSLNGDLKDNAGGFNAGRPSGYIEDFKSLPKATQDLMRNTKRTKVVFGVVTMKGAMDDKGNPIEDNSITDVEIPFVMDVKSRGTIKAIDDAIKVLDRKEGLLLQYKIELSAEMHEKPDGSEYATMVLTPNVKVDIVEQDKEYLHNFMDWISGMNNYISSEHDKKNADSLGADALEALHDIVDVEVAD